MTPTEADTPPQEFVEVSPAIADEDPRGRVTVVSHVSLQMPGMAPYCAAPRFCRWLETDEQVFPRITTVGPDWEQVQAGWLSSGCSQLVLENIEGQCLQRQPSPEEQADIALRIIELGERQGMTVLVRPGESCRLEPSSLSTLLMRCLHGRAKYSLTLFPR